MSSAHSCLVAFAAALVFAAPASAQQRAGAEVGVAPLTSSMRVTAPMVAVAPAFAIESTVASTVAPLPPQQRQSHNMAMMIVGGAALVVGSLIDGDTGTIIMVGGAVVGLIGLFRYLR